MLLMVNFTTFKNISKPKVSNGSIFIQHSSSFESMADFRTIVLALSGIRTLGERRQNTRASHRRGH
jgi:hypothetical protein